MVGTSLEEIFAPFVELSFVFYFFFVIVY